MKMLWEIMVGLFGTIMAVLLSPFVMAYWVALALWELFGQPVQKSLARRAIRP